MIGVILKNVILVLLIILIVHFMLKNKLIEERDSFVRRIVHKELVDKVSNKIEEEEIEMSKKRVSGEKRVHFEDTFSPEIERECPGQVKCEDYMKEGENEEDKMKELYDFVFDKEEGETEGSLNSFFPTNVEDKTVVDSNEIDQHINEIDQKTNCNCQFEIIGVIEDKTDILGVDVLSAANYSNL